MPVGLDAAAGDKEYVPGAQRDTGLGNDLNAVLDDAIANHEALLLPGQGLVARSPGVGVARHALLHVAAVQARECPALLALIDHGFLKPQAIELRKLAIAPAHGPTVQDRS